MIYNTIYAEKGKIADLVDIIKMKPVTFFSFKLNFTL